MNDYENVEKVIELNSDEISLLTELLKEYSYSSIPERHLVEDFLFKLQD
jgi:hypothetical protein